MGAGIHGGFGNTLGSTYGNSNSTEETYADTNMVEMETVDNVKISVDCGRVEDEYGITVRHRANLAYLLYNLTADYVNLLLGGQMKHYLDEATDFILDK